MAAVLCLILLPLLAAVGFMLGVTRDMSLGSIAGGIAFVLLGAFMFLGAMHMSRGWDEEGTR